MAYDSWGKVYNTVKRTLMAERNRITYFVLDAMATYCDSFGVTWVSAERLSDDVGYAVEGVRAALEDLMARDWLRVHVEASELKRRTELIWQLSPAVIYLRDEHLMTAWSSYHKAHKDTTVTSIFMKESEPIPLPNARTKPGPKTRPKTRPSSSSNKQAHSVQNVLTAESPTADSTSAKRQENSAHSAPQNPAQSATNNPPPSSAAPPRPKPDLSAYDSPLPDPTAEALAWRVKLSGTSIRMARYLVASEGESKVQDAYNYVKERILEGEGVRNPVGMMISLLNTGAIAPGERPGWSKKEWESRNQWPI